MNPLEKLIQDRYPLIPEDVQGYLSSSVFSSDINSISSINSLDADQQKNLTTEIILVFLAVENPADFIRNVKGELNIDSDRARKIANDVNEKIFQPLKTALQEMFVEKGTTETKVGAAHAPEIHTDHILPQEPEEDLPSGKEEKNTQTVTKPQQNPLQNPPPHFNYPLSTTSAPISAPLPPVSAFQTLEKDVNQIADSQKSARSLAEQKLKSVTGQPKEEKKFEIPDPKNRTYDPYREPLN